MASDSLNSQLEPIDQGDDSKVRAVAISMMVLSSILVLLRLAARSLQRGALGLDDWIIIISQAIVILLFTTSLILSNKGVGLHLSTSQKDILDIETIRRWLFIKEIAYISSMTSIKFSILALFTRLFPTRFTIISARVLALATAVWFIVALLASIFQCRPISENWLVMLNGTFSPCSGTRQSFLGITITHIFLDVFTLCLPIKEVKGLQMLLWKKVAVCAIFIAGGFVTVLSIIRVILLVQVFDSTFASFGDDTADFIIPAILWTDIEAGFGVLCACLPVLRPIIRLVARPFTSTKILDNPTQHIFRTRNTMRAPTDNRGSSFYGGPHEGESLRDLMPNQPEIPAKPPSLILRRDKTEHNTTIYTGDVTPGTDIALDIISVKRDFRWEEERQIRQEDKEIS
ncbi:hypothetical protein F5Y13DRAFT_190671 [Hypoxylon sp. FL1857]|nr:hypothetical protein F5Y13DRAFT_190671 [Hypoxylon sp. FL1857]